MRVSIHPGQAPCSSLPSSLQMAAWDRHAFFSSRSSFQREKRGGQGEKNSRNTSKEAEGSLPELQQPGPNATQPLEVHVQAPEVAQQWQQDDQGQSRKGKASVTGAGGWLGTECGLTVRRQVASTARHRPEGNVGRAWQGPREDRRLRVKGLPKRGSWTVVAKVARESPGGRNYESKTGMRGTPHAPESPRDGTREVC